MNLYLKPSYTLFFILASLILLLPYPAQAESKTLKVGVALGEPFAVVHDNEYQGIAIDIWKKISEEQNLKYQFVSMGEHIDDAVKQLAAGQIDVLIGPIVPTYDRMKLADFMQPYYLNQIGLVVPVNRVVFLNALGSIFNGPLKSALLILLVFFVLYLHVYWYYEIKLKQRRESYWDGITESFWLHTLDIDLATIPSHLRTRQFRFLWLILLAFFFSSVTAAITSALTIALADKYTSYNSIDDFKNKEVVAVVNTAPYDIAKSMGFANIITVDNREQAINLLLEGKVSAYVDYYPIADYYLKQHQLTRKLIMASYILQKNTFAFALPLNSPLRHPLNLKLRSHQEYGLIKIICAKYFKDDEKSTINCEI